MPQSSLLIDDQSPAWRAELAKTVLRKLSLHARLTEDERDRLLDIPKRPRRIAPRRSIVDEGDTPGAACALISGHAFRYKMLPNGARQILSFYHPGDLIDLDSTLVGRADDGVAALSEIVVAHLPHDEVMAAMTAHSGIARAFWRETLVEGSIFREWLLNIGRRDALGRIAHLLCETGLRSAAAGVGDADRFAFPVTQVDLADATAMTPVHVNRTLQRLRGVGLIDIAGGIVSIHDRSKLAEVGSFDPGYLHLPSQTWENGSRA